jgi:hypothetical protein
MSFKRRRPVNEVDLLDLLEKEGWSVKEAGNGREALEAVAQELPSLIMLDLTMPVMDGFEFAREFRKVEPWKNVPIVVITAMDLDEAELAELRVHVDSVIQKSGMSGEQVLESARRAIDNWIA